MSQARTCQLCSTGFTITDEDLKFYDKASPIFAEKKYALPPPKLCPRCRQRRRLSFRNERNLYSGKCALCQKPIITIYSPDKKFTVYCRDCWWSDKWDCLSYGRDFDFKRPFFDQYKELLGVVPKAAIISYNCENCEYTNYQNDSRNCYLTFGSGKMEDCLYTNWCYEAKNIMDCSFCIKGELDYMNVDCFQTYHSMNCFDCKVLTDCLYCIDCRGCQNCFGCVGLRKKEFHIFNKPYTKEQYQQMVAELLKPGNKEKVKAEIRKLKLQHPHVSTRITNGENCTGDDIENCKNTQECYGVRDCFDCKYNYDIQDAKDQYDANRTGYNELTYEICSGGYYKYSHFVYGSAHINFSHYVLECNYCDHIFGCVGVKSKKYLILNKQYSKEEYESLVPRILEHMNKTGEWGEFPPSGLSAFGYNETLANEYFPLRMSEANAADTVSAKQEALSKGFNWCDYEVPNPVVAKVIKPNQMPHDIRRVTDDILGWAVECEVTGKPFKVAKQELEFYRKNSLPVPVRHPNQRYKDRLALQNPRQLFDRQCGKCHQAIKTIYSPNRPEIVYCEKCYLETVY